MVSRIPTGSRCSPMALRPAPTSGVHMLRCASARRRSASASQCRCPRLRRTGRLCSRCQRPRHRGRDAVGCACPSAPRSSKRVNAGRVSVRHDHSTLRVTIRDGSVSCPRSKPSPLRSSPFALPDERRDSLGGYVVGHSRWPTMPTEATEAPRRGGRVRGAARSQALSARSATSVRSPPRPSSPPCSWASSATSAAAELAPGRGPTSVVWRTFINVS
jgi:hypothetical protein